MTETNTVTYRCTLVISVTALLNDCGPDRTELWGRQVTCNIELPYVPRAGDELVLPAFGARAVSHVRLIVATGRFHVELEAASASDNVALAMLGDLRKDGFLNHDEE